MTYRWVVYLAVVSGVDVVADWCLGTRLTGGWFLIYT